MSLRNYIHTCAIGIDTSKCTLFYPFSFGQGSFFVKRTLLRVQDRVLFGMCFRSSRHPLRGSLVLLSFMYPEDVEHLSLIHKMTFGCH